MILLGEVSMTESVLMILYKIFSHKGSKVFYTVISLMLYKILRK